ncbi:putative protein OS=Streptomyces griseorubiginosus OX=67304 GN=DWG14_08417 PE=4 SV=1 [Streptomyces griseorubiginosus]
MSASSQIAVVAATSWPEHGSLDDPAMATQPLRGFDAFAGNGKAEAPLAEPSAQMAVVVSFIDVELGWSPATRATRATRAAPGADRRCPAYVPPVFRGRLELLSQSDGRPLRPPLRLDPRCRSARPVPRHAASRVCEWCLTPQLRARRLGRLQLVPQGAQRALADREGSIDSCELRPGGGLCLLQRGTQCRDLGLVLPRRSTKLLLGLMRANCSRSAASWVPPTSGADLYAAVPAAPGITRPEGSSARGACSSAPARRSLLPSPEWEKTAGYGARPGFGPAPDRDVRCGPAE